jgi:hypothetical protein
MAVKHYKLSKNYSFFIDKHGSGFAGGFVIYPAITVFKSKGFYQISFSFIKRTISLTVMHIKQRY